MEADSITDPHGLHTFTTFNPMSEKQIEHLSELQPGDIVRHVTGYPYLVTANFGDRVTAVRTADITNTSEWILVSKAKHDSV